MKMEKYSIRAIIVLSLFFVFNLFDTISTHLLITLGIAREANPLMAFVIAKGGFVSAYIMKILSGILVWFVFVKNWDLRISRVCGYILTSIYGLLSLYHIGGWVYYVYWF